MTIQKLCKFYRDIETIRQNSKAIGCCDLDCNQTTCDGEIDFCQNPDMLKRYLFAQMGKEGGLKWVVKRNVPLFIGNQKV
jgi:hypothetical protein